MDGRGEGPVAAVRANSLKPNGGAAADGADANRPPQPAPEKNNLIAEFGSRLPSAKAEYQAFTCCVVEWLNRNPVGSPLRRCLASASTPMTRCCLTA